MEISIWQWKMKASNGETGRRRRKGDSLLGKKE
jgi:hypothetical protein